MQKPGGLIFPDSATLRMCAIEDQSYKDEKINCKLADKEYRGREVKTEVKGTFEENAVHWLEAKIL